MNPTCITFVAALVGGLALTPVARLAARRCQAVDRPDGRRKLHPAPVPLWGGIAVYSALLFGLLAAGLVWPHEGAELARLSMVVALTAGLLCAIGCLDDVLDLNPRLKLVLQTASTMPVVLTGYYVERIAVFGHPVELGWLGVILTILWIVGCINALNLLDGMDGLASIVGVLSATMIALIAATGQHHHVALIAMAMSGALIGFLAYNLPPASIYLGDSGSMVIGLVIGILAFQGSLETSATLSITIPAVVMTIPILDTALALARRD